MRCAGDTIQGYGGTDHVFMTSIQGATVDGGTGVNSLTLLGAISSVDADGKLVTVYADQDMVVDLANFVVSTHSQRVPGSATGVHR